jgi:hypothetical protein
MRLWALVLASAVVWLVTPVASLADAESPVAGVGEVAGEAAAPTEGEISGALDAPEEGAEPGAHEAAADETEGVSPAAPAAASAPAGAAPTWEDFDDQGFDPTQTEPAPSQRTLRKTTRASSIPLGPMGVDAKGVEGRIHTVSRGETLWDISEAYLGTPWVWPSVWNENDEIDNPHRISPGDRIWITSNEMRRVTDEEAEQLISSATTPADEGELPAFDEGEMLVADEPLPASVEDERVLSAPVPLAAASSMTGQVLLLPREPDANFVDASALDEAAEIVESGTIRVYLTQGDLVYVDLGEGEASVGDQFTIFRDIAKIRDVETGAVLGYHYDDLGWVEITQVEGEASRAVVRGASDDIVRGDRLLPRKHVPREVTLRRSMDDVEGAIVFTPGYRWMMGTSDSVYLNVGSIHGIEVGAQMEVYDPGIVVKGSQMPDTVYAQMVVISVEAESSVAFVTQTERELEIGNDVRTLALDEFAGR